MSYPCTGIWRQFPKYKSGAVLNLKVARKEGSRGRLSEQFANGLVPKNRTQLQKGKLGVGATSERAIGRGGWNRGCATPYRTALYRTWGQGQQPSGLSPGSAKGPSDGRWNSPRLSLLVDGVVCLPSSLGSRNALRNGERGGPFGVPGLAQSPPPTTRSTHPGYRRARARAESPLAGPDKWRAGCGVIPVYRDLSPVGRREAGSWAS